MENYGLALKKLRLHFKYTQREIADKVGVSNHAVSKWENGINQPDISTLRLICDIYGVTTEQFFRIASGESVENVLSLQQSAAQAELHEEGATTTENLNLQGAGTHSTGKTPPKRWWVWLIIGGLVVSALTGIALAAGGKDDGQSSQPSQSVSAPLDSSEAGDTTSETPQTSQSSNPENNYVVRFEKQDGTILSTRRYNYDEAWTISDSIITGYSFDFWLCNGEKYDGGDTFIAAEGEEYVFVAHYTPNKFLIRYMIPIHSYFYEKEVYYCYDGENYLCAGLFDDEGWENCIGGWIINGVEYDANAFIGNLSSQNGAIFEASPIWKKGKAQASALIFNSGDEDNGASFVRYAREEEKVTMPICEWEKDGYVFKGWKEEKTGKEYLVGEAFTLPFGEEEYTFTAVWEEKE